jgi:TolB-like protein
MSLIAELKRRNVFRVAVAYAVIAWVLAQVADLAFDNFGAPDWVPKSVLFVLLLGFPLAIFFAWAFEMTPEGVKKEKDVDRSESITSQTGRKLDFLIIGVLVIAVGLLLVDKFVLREVALPVSAEATATPGADKSVAVLPFVAMSSGPDDEYFADGMTEEILNSLARVPDLLVTARTSTFAFKGLDVSIPEIAAKLGVAHVVEGSVRRAGDRLRITAQLIRAHDGFHLWSETYDRSAADSFGVQGEIATKIAAALDIVLEKAQLAKMRSSGLRNPEAFIAYQKGVKAMADAHAKFGNAEFLTGLRAANMYFERVIELDPEFSAAYFDHGDYYVHYVLSAAELGLSAEDTAQAIERARLDYQAAVDTAKIEGDKLTAALEQTLVSGRWRRLPELLSAAAKSSDCIAAGWWGVFSALDLSDESLAMWQHSLACDPLYYFSWTNLARAQTYRGEYVATIDTAVRGLDAVPHSAIAGELFSAYLATGQFDAALATSQRFEDDERARDIDRLQLAAVRGDAIVARAIKNEIEADSAAEPLSLAVSAILGDRAEANRLAALADAQPLGFLTLLSAIAGCYCGAPFDFAVTPNFARMIGETNLPWPPPSPIKWPLKDW